MYQSQILVCKTTDTSDKLAQFVQWRVDIGCLDNLAALGWMYTCIKRLFNWIIQVLRWLTVGVIVYVVNEHCYWASDIQLSHRRHCQVLLIFDCHGTHYALGSEYNCMSSYFLSSSRNTKDKFVEIMFVLLINNFVFDIIQTDARIFKYVWYFVWFEIIFPKVIICMISFECIYYNYYYEMMPILCQQSMFCESVQINTHTKKNN